MKRKMDYITQFGPIRSGSTLIYNLLRGMHKDVVNQWGENHWNIEKEHELYYSTNKLYVVTVRHPYNCIISSILRYNEEITKSTLKENINEYLKRGGLDVCDDRLNSENVLILKYERFFPDLNYAIDSISKFTQTEISTSLRSHLIESLSIGSIKSLIKQYKGFHEHDPEAQWHGNHISKHNGSTDFNKILTQNQLKILASNSDLNSIIRLHYDR